MMDLTWLFAKENDFIDFVGVVNKSENLLIYQSDFITALVSEFWDEHYMKLFWRVFVPHIAYMALIHFYLMAVLD